MSKPLFNLRNTWRNYVNDQTANPIRLFHPHSLTELRDILEEARQHGHKVKAIGSGHSSSNIAISRDYMIDTHGLDQVLDPGWLDLIPGQPVNDRLFFVEAGIRIKAVNTALEQKGAALINMGAYDGQTIAGVISTSTHGSGVTLGAFPDYLKAIFLLTEDGTLRQIERSAGTDTSTGTAISTGPAKIPGAGAITFIRDDEYFYSVGVSMGCMGIIYAVVIEVMDKYMLEETRSFSQWADVKKELQGGLLYKYRHVEVLVSPYRYKGHDHKCMVTKRKIIDRPYKSPLIPRGHRKILPELLVRIVPDFLIDAVIRFIVNHFPRTMPAFVQSELSTLSDRDYVDKSYKVLNLGADNNLAAYAAEIALPGSTYLDAVEEIIRVVNHSVKEGEQYLNAPFSLRFVKSNAFYLSMQYSAKPDDFFCMIEFPTVSGTIGGMELLARIESALYRFGGIPHWGQINHIGGTGRSSVGRLYPRFADWMRVYHKLCPENRFANDFTNICGISNSF
jgi:FAD/FMN-containing dehydrogenase